MYKSLIRPLLEYGNTVRKPYYKKDSEALEKVQRRATKLVPRIKDLPYLSRLKVLQLPTLIYRRRRADMLQVYRILTGMDKVEVSRFFKLEGDGNRRGHRYKLFKPRVESKVKSNSLSIRVINDWNVLSDEVVSAETINQFKSRLEVLWSQKDFKYDPSGFHG